MNISEKKVVTIDYTLKNKEGKILDTTNNRSPLSFIFGNGSIITGLENALNGKNAGDSFSITIDPEDAYGNYNEELIFSVPKEHFQTNDELQIGMQVQVQTETGAQILLIKSIDTNDVILDANHPLAGQTLHFDIFISDVREATEEELSHGHLHYQDSCGCESCDECDSCNEENEEK